jgi:hypothetical protein
MDLAALATTSDGASRCCLRRGTPRFCPRWSCLPVVGVLPSRRWFLTKTWDRFQIPKPFCTLSLIFAEPILPREDEDAEALRVRVARAMNALERKYDPDEAERVPDRARGS